MSTRNVIDGQRKAVIVEIGDGMVRFDGLVTESQWGRMGRKAGRIIVTQRALMGATLHDQSLGGQFPPVGHTFAAALLTGRSGQFATGRQMSAHLATLKAEAKAGREAIKVVKALRAAII